MGRINKSTDTAKAAKAAKPEKVAKLSERKPVSSGLPPPKPTPPKDIVMASDLRSDWAAGARRGGAAGPALPPTSIAKLSPAEKKQFFATFSKAAADFARVQEKAEWDAIKETGVGLRYGAKSKYAGLTDAGKREWVTRALVAHGNPRAGDKAYVQGLIDKMKPTSCIGFTMQTLEVAYKAAGQAERWAEIKKTVTAKGTVGTELLKELQRDGFEGVYWNANTKFFPPNENYKEKSVASDHKTFQTRFLKPDGTLKPGGDYYGVKVHHVLANFREDNLAKPADFKLNHSVLQKFDGVPWGVGVAASGYHTFAIEGQNVHESHQGRNPQDPTNLEHRPWYELGFDDLAKGEWSREQSGVIVVPPGTFKD